MGQFDFYRTDLVVENEEMVRHQTDSEKDKLQKTDDVVFNETRHGSIMLTKVKILPEAEERIGKKTGTYITLTSPSLPPGDKDGISDMTAMLMDQLDELLKEHKLPQDAKLLFIGLGNREVTPDAVGPMTMDRMTAIVPDYFSEEGAEVFVYAPGVTIQTGLETAEFVRAMADQIKPDLLIVVDALAARDSARLCRTIQMTDTGIHPGSGVGNSRKELSKETLGVPVIAIGIPTVVDGPVLIADAIDTMFTYIASKIEDESRPSSKLTVSNWLYEANENADRSKLIPIFGDWSSWPHEDRVQLFEEVLSNRELNTFISPKEIDAWVAMYADCLADSFFGWIDNLKASH